MLALNVLWPQSGRAQAMVRGEPVLSSPESGNGGPAVNVNGSVDAIGDETVRQPQIAGVQAGRPTGGIDTSVSNIDLTGDHGSLLALNKWSWRPIFYLTLGVAYNDNIFVRHEKVGDLVSTIAPGIILAAGDYQTAVPRWGFGDHPYEVPQDDVSLGRFVYFEYHPTVYLFARNSDQNSVDEYANLLGGYTFTKLALGGQLLFEKLSGDDIDAGGRINRDLYSANLTSIYTYSDKTAWEINFYGYDREYEAPYESSTEVQNQDYLNYRYGLKTTVSAGVAFGYVDYRHYASQPYEQALLRVSGQLYTKLFYTLTGGIEFRENQDSANTVDGVFKLNVTYNQSDATTYIFAASRNTEPSALDGQEVTYTRVELAWQQRLASRVFLSLDGSYSEADYGVISDAAAQERTDHTGEITLGITTDITRYATIQVAYIFRDNASTISERAFTENVAGVQLHLTY